MSIQNYIKENIMLLGSNVYVAPNIPDNKLNGAITSYAPEVYADYVLALKDSSLLSLGREGCLFLGDSVYLKGNFEKPLKLEYYLIDKIEYFTTEKSTRFGKVETIENVNIFMKDNEVYDMNSYLTNVNSLGFVKLIEGILEEAEKGGEYVTTSQVMPLSEMSEDIKLNYIKIVANFAYSYDQQVDVEEYTEIMSLISRVELNSETRLDVRAYLSDKKSIISNELLLTNIKENIEENNFDILNKSLAKDILYFFGIKEELSNWSENTFIQDVFEMLLITEEEIKVLIAAIKNDEDILKYRKNDS